LPNYVEIGEVGLQMARKLAPSVTENVSALLTREVTTVLEQGRALTPDSLRGLSSFVSNAAQKDLPLLSKTLGLAGRDEGAVIIGKKLNSGSYGGPHLTVYEPHRNVTIRSDGSFHIASPTPSGQRLMTQNFNWKGSHAEVNQRTRYADVVNDPYPQIIDPARPYAAMLANVITTGESRQFGVGTWNWMSGRNNFMPAKELIDAVKATKPVDITDAAINKVMGTYVSNPLASGWLVGFDRKAGEALVSFGDWPTAGFEHWRPTNAVVKNLDGLYPVDVAKYRASSVTAFRNAVGKIFEAEKVPEGYKLAPSSRVFAFKPSEVGLQQGSLSEVLGIEPQTGLRALGGYDTQAGGRIPISVGGL
jgi:hypothetical protein